MKERYHISGMSCSACSSRVERVAGKLDGVEKASVNLLTETMDIVYDASVLSGEDIIAAVGKAGYGAERMQGSRAGSTAGGAGKAQKPRADGQSVDAGEAQEQPVGSTAGGASVGQGQADAGGEAREQGTDGGRTRGSRSREGQTHLQHRARQEARAMRWRLGISIAFLLPLMYVAMFHMYQEWFGLPVPGFVHNTLHGNENAMTFALTQLLLLLPILYVNRKFFAVGFRTLLHRAPNMDSLIALGASAAIGYGIFAMYRISYGLGHGDMSIVEQYSHDLYFESAGMILTLITVGKYLESRSKGKTGEAITKLMDLSPKMAIRVRADGSEEEIPTEELREGDFFLVKPGSLIPADGTVQEGASSVDESAITGESIPVEKQPGAKVVSATVNKAGFLKCSADRVGEDTTLSQIVRLMEEAGASKAPIAQLADKVAGVFVPVVMGIALVTLIIWLLAGAGAEFAISSAIAVLVISCPCALGLATPVAIMVGTGVGANHGILIKSGEALQRAKEVDTVVLDKTGTVTAGRLKVMGWGCYAPEVAPEIMLSLAAALEKKSEHPLAEAVTAYAEREKLLLPTIRDFQAVFGRGVTGILAEEIAWEEGTDGTGSFRTLSVLKGDGPIAAFCAGRLSTEAVRENSAGKQMPYGGEAGAEEEDCRLRERKFHAGTRCLIGNRAFLEENGICLTEEQAQGLNEAADEGMTPLLVAADGQLLGNILVADEIRASSVGAIRHFHKMGIRVIMLTGDNRRTAEAVRRQVGVEEVIAEVQPQDKEREIRKLQAAGKRVAMIGDGINDAPALAAADVGMAIGAGTDVAMESADIVLMKSDLRDAATAVKLSREVIRNIRQNLFWAFFYNAIGIPLAAGVWYPLFEVRLSPMFGAAAMSMSSIFVVGNALRLRGFRSDFATGKNARPAEAADRDKTAQSAAGLSGEQEAKREADAKRETVAEKEMRAAEVCEGVNDRESAESVSEGRKEMRKIMTIEGMMCGHCTGRVQKALEAIEGVSGVVMSLEEKTATVSLAREVSDATLTAAVTEAGYEVKKIEG